MDTFDSPPSPPLFAREGVGGEFQVHGWLYSSLIPCEESGMRQQHNDELFLSSTYAITTPTTITTTGNSLYGFLLSLTLIDRRAWN